VLSVQNVVLGALIGRRGYGYGYELCDQLRDFSEALGYSPTFVYAALDALERQGLIRELRRENTGRRGHARVYFEVTEKGRGTFRSWIETTPQKTPLREEIHMLLLAAGDAEDLPFLIAALSGYEEECRQQLGDLMERPFGSLGSRGRSTGTVVVQDALISHLQTSMEWAQRTRQSLQRLLAHPTGVPGRHRP
jgi:DNA-binding PadR family transcriptional regulator